MMRCLVVSDALSALRDRSHVAPLCARVELPRASDLLLGIRNHFVPLRDPAYGPRQREDRSEQADWNTERALHDARVEIDVRVELALHEVIVLERDFLQRHRQLERSEERRVGKECTNGGWKCS